MKSRAYFSTSRPRRNGFTMIELLVAATILAVLSAIGLVSFRSANIRARDGKRKADLAQVQSALEQYRTDEGSYPEGYSLSNASWNSMVTTLAEEEYLNSATMSDPKNVDLYVYEYESDANGRTYQVCAYLETTEATYCLNNP